MARLNRKQKRAAAKTRGKIQSTGTRLPPSRFRDQMEELAVLGGFANHVSMAQTGLRTTVSGSMGSMVFAKMCAHARSIGAIALSSSMFDHHAIMTLARMIIEAATMLAYLNEVVSDDEWELRHAVLRLHDTVTRIKLLRSFGGETADLRAGRDDLKAKLEAMEMFATLTSERQTRLLSGEEMYVTGMRSVAVKTAGWNEDQFNALYAYLSAHTHSAPMSFVRMESHRVDYFQPSATQLDIVAVAMEVAMACLRRAMIAQIDRHPEQIDEYQPDLLSEARERNAGCPFFGVATPRAQPLR